jgi:hypothetical protein
MANKFQLKRTTVAGRTANTTDAANTAFLDKGELAINLTDRKVFSSDAANNLFEVGSNLSSLAVTTIVANNSAGSSGQILASNGSGVYWTSSTAELGSVNWAQNTAPQAFANTTDSFPKALASVTITTSGSPVQIGAYGDAENKAAGVWGKLQLYRGSTPISGNVHYEGSAVSENSPFAFTHIDNPVAGTYTYYLYCTQVAGGNTHFGETSGPTINVVELQNVRGAQGATGAQGAQGATGAQGAQGAQGPQGDTGAQGATGAQGSTGSQGAQGTQGETGAQGATGSQGAQGTQGATGPQGAQGATGLGFSIAKSYASVAALTADTSPTAIVAGEFAIIETGNVNDAENSRLYLWNGSVYSYVTDLSGAAGFTGPQGATGAQGAQGTTGDTGAQGAQGLTGAQGAQGATGAQGTTGAQGATGDTGAQGAQGITGSQGATGAQGAQGTTGAQGVQGAQGITGPQGAIGPQGAQGDVGPTGPQGPGVDANLSVTWANTQIFNANVTFNAGIIANGSIGSTGKVLTSNGTSVYWGEGGTSSNAQSGVVTYTYAISSNTTVITGADAANATLSYTTGFESVYLNGSKQILTTDYTTPNTSTIVFTSNVISGDVVQVVASVPALNFSVVTYTYAISSNTTIITGPDESNATLSYTAGAGLESVYLNGSKQILTTDYTTPNTSAIVFTSNVISGDVVQVVASITSLNFIEASSNSVATTTTANNVVDSFIKTLYRSAKYYIQIASGTDYHVTEALLLHDGSDVFITEYGTIFSNTSLGNVTATINSANVELLVAPTNASSVVKTKRITVEV